MIVPDRVLRNIRPAFDEPIDERTQQPVGVGCFLRGSIVDQSKLDQVGPQPAGKLARPRFGGCLGTCTGRLGADQLRHMREDGARSPLAHIAQPQGALFAGVIAPADLEAGPVALLLMQ
ncbi:hypothetical protein [Roseimaritima sediminicola]|uniref:hypothetical protein n=1 Tax=Roseimaritima sediminicola TaxID=2662066 RepID=UPI001F3A8FE4|nr:hypothetical protein [Roseimaritima sediminicola]